MNDASATKLKLKTTVGLMWSLLDAFAVYGFSFIFSIFLARILTPSDFGTVSILVIIIGFSQTFVNSGFSQALIRKRRCTDKDYSTALLFNVSVSIIIVMILFFSAEVLSTLFNSPQIAPIIKYASIIIVIDAMSIVQRTILIRNINFKKQTVISGISSLCAGGSALYLAVHGYGIWSLVLNMLIRSCLNTVLLWSFSDWAPVWKFSKSSLNYLWGYGSKLLFSGLLTKIFDSGYYLVVGAYFSLVELGYYNRADKYQKLPSQNLNNIIQRVSFPVFSSVSENKTELKRICRRFLTSSMFISFIVMFGLFASADSFIISLIGEKWEPSVIYLKLLCLAGMLYPFHSINLNVLNVLGRSDLFLKLEILKKILLIPILFAGVFFGIKTMIYLMIVNSVIAVFINSFWAREFINYSSLEQIKDILPSFILALTMCLILLLFKQFSPFNNSTNLIIQIIAGAGYVLIVSEIFKLKDYIFIKNTVSQYLFEIKQRNATVGVNG
jgi:teichuronic acid exporter